MIAEGSSPVGPTDPIGGVPGSTLLVAAAWEPELERLRTLVPPDLGANLKVGPVGIGLVDAAVGTTRCILQHGLSNLILIGTCGASKASGLRIGDVIVGTTVRLIDPVVVERRAALPYEPSALAFDERMIAAISAAGAREASIINTLGITTDDALAAKLAPLGQVEHLEAYGVARACQAESVRCAVVLAVANLVGARGRDEWRANHVAASGRAAEIAWKAIQSVRTSTTPRSRG